MAAVIAFPKKRKPGPKVKSGPVASVIALRPPEDRAIKPVRESAAFDALVTALLESAKKDDLKMRERFLRLTSGAPCTAEYYGNGTSWGSATTTKGSGPEIYGWSKGKIHARDVLRFHEKDKALELAINVLNMTCHLIRFGGLRVGNASALEGFDEEVLRTYEYSCVALLGEAMVMLRAHGAGDGT
jgi:hypothetical protein